MLKIYTKVPLNVMCINLAVILHMHLFKFNGEKKNFLVIFFVIWTQTHHIFFFQKKKLFYIL